MGVSVAVGVTVGEGVIVIVGVGTGTNWDGNVQASPAVITKSKNTSTKRTLNEVDMGRNINDDQVSVNEN